MSNKSNWMVAMGVAVALSGSCLFAEDSTAFGFDQSKFSELHKSGYAVQISDTVDLAYYTQNHEYTFGIGNIGYTQWGNSSSFSPTIFGRRNFPLTSNLVVGYGGSIGTTFGTLGGVAIESALRVKPYVFFEYAASKNFLVGASVSLFKYSTQTVRGTQTDVTEYVKASTVQIAVLF